MKAAVILCLMCVMAVTYAQVPGAASSSSRSAAGAMAMRGLMGRAMARRGGMGGGLGLMLMNGAIDSPMEMMLCQQNFMLCMMMMQ